ncbi:MAG: hypothetical protein PHD02_03190 [Bacilli bacterium]|nr:hypothetical protein [Bacilli bacterium]
MKNIVLEKKKKFVFINIIIGLSLVLLIFTFITIDYLRANNGKKPLFAIHRVGVTTVDVVSNDFKDTVLNDIESSVYYGIGYSVSVCDNRTSNYKFKLGEQPADPCFTILNCSEKDDLGIDRYYEYSFFDSKLYRVSQITRIPIANVDETEESLQENTLELNNINGCGATFEKIDNTTYEIVQVCNILNMSESDIIDIYSAGYKSLIDTRTTKEDIIDYYHNWMVCE